MNILASLIGGAISTGVARLTLKPATKLTSYLLRQYEGTAHGTAAAQALAPQIAAMTQGAGDAVAAQAVQIASKAAPKSGL